MDYIRKRMIIKGVAGNKKTLPLTASFQLSIKYEGKTFFEKKVLPLKLPFPKNFSKGEKVRIRNIASDQRERVQYVSRGSADWGRRLAA